jgi:type II secretory pathway component PulF
MGLFSYVAKDSQGLKISGTLEANDQYAALEVLHKKGLIIIAVKEEKVKKVQEKRGQA